MQRGLANWSRRVPVAASSRVSVAPLVGSTRGFSSAFEPSTYLHQDAVRSRQTKSFLKFLDSNEDALSTKLTPEEMNQLKSRALLMRNFDDINMKMTNLFSPQRHNEIRKTRTWAYMNEAVEEFFKDDTKAAEKLVFGDNETFINDFKKSYLVDDSRNHYLSAMCLADLRYAVASIAIEKSTDHPPLLAVFGCRNNYHYKLPDPYSPSAEFQSISNCRVMMRTIVMCTVFNCVKEGRPMTPKWFAEMLASETDNNLKSDPRWYEIAEVISRFSQERFYDQLERQWVWFQTDEGVTKLKPKFPTDYYNNKPRIYSQEELWEYKGKYYVE